MTFYRLDTGKVHTCLVPDHGVLRRRTVERLHAGLGYHPGLPGHDPLGVDCPQFWDEPGVGLCEVDVDPMPLGEISSGSLPLRIISATEDSAEAIVSCLRDLDNRLSPAAKHAARLIEIFNERRAH